MEKLDAYKIDLKAMVSDVETRSLMADNDFFAAVQGDEIQYGNVAVELVVRQTAGAFQVMLDFHGEVQVMCDRCLEPMMQPVAGEAELRVKWGETYEDDGDTIVVPEDEGVVDLSWQVYEQIALQIPFRHVHVDGECNEEMQNALMMHETHAADSDAQNDTSESTSHETDPRWDALKKLISTNN